MVTTTPRTWNDDGIHSPRLVDGVVEQIIDAYKFALRDEDKAGDVDTAAYNEGRRMAFEEVLDLLHPKHPNNSYAVTLGLDEDPVAFLPVPADQGQSFLFLRAGQQDLIGVEVANHEPGVEPVTLNVGYWPGGEEWEVLKSWTFDDHSPLHGIDDPAITTHADRLRADQG